MTSSLLLDTQRERAGPDRRGISAQMVTCTSFSTGLTRRHPRLTENNPFLRVAKSPDHGKSDAGPRHVAALERTCFRRVTISPRASALARRHFGNYAPRLLKQTGNQPRPQALRTPLHTRLEVAHHLVVTQEVSSRRKRPPFIPPRLAPWYRPGPRKFPMGASRTVRTRNFPMGASRTPDTRPIVTHTNPKQVCHLPHGDSTPMAPCGRNPSRRASTDPDRPCGLARCPKPRLGEYIVHAS